MLLCRNPRTQEVCRRRQEWHQPFDRGIGRHCCEQPCHIRPPGALLANGHCAHMCGALHLTQSQLRIQVYQISMQFAAMES